MFNYYSVHYTYNYTATTQIFTLSLHDALPIYVRSSTAPGRSRAQSLLRKARQAQQRAAVGGASRLGHADAEHAHRDRKSTRLNSSHSSISYAVFCLKKKKIIMKQYILCIYSIL